MNSFSSMTIRIVNVRGKGKKLKEIPLFHCLRNFYHQWTLKQISYILVELFVLEVGAISKNLHMRPK